MIKKFVIFYNFEYTPVIVLAETDLHKNIKSPTEFGSVMDRNGGGKWIINNGVLILYGSSLDFGNYDQDMALEAFQNKNVYYHNERCYDKFELKNIVLE